MTAVRRERRRDRGERAMVPKAEFRSYYGLPVLNAPVWKVDIPAYFFLGGLAGASSLLGAAAQWAGRPVLARRVQQAAPAALALGTVALVRDLGRPSRFYNMLRVFKPSSPMSVGSWLLAAYGPAAGLAAVTARTGRLARLSALAGGSAALLGPLVSTYTAALVSNTAVPAWHDSYRELPFVFAGSSAAAAGGVGLALAPASEVTPARRMAVLGSALELVASRRMEQRLGPAGPYRSGRSAAYARSSRAATAGGLVLALGARKSRLARVAAGACFAGASALTRMAVFEAGRESAADPQQTIAPQRARLAATTPPQPPL